MKYLMILSLLLATISTAFAGGNTRVPDFNSAKKILKKLSYLGVEREIYCNCKILPNNKFDRSSCGYVPRKDNERARRLEAEHVVPFENIAGNTTAWDNGAPECRGKKGRACASKVYGHVEGDLWNLMPSIGELNGLRSNYTIAEIPGEAREFGTCDFEIESRKVEPPESIKPLMAVTYQYMQETYAAQLHANLISGKNEKLIAVWANKPLPAWACTWGKRVVSVQGNENRFLIAKCKQQSLW